MKAIYIIIATASALAFTSCEDKSKQKLDPNARIYINSAQVPQSTPSYTPNKVEGDEQVKLTPLQMLLETDELTFSKGDIGIGGEEKDTANVRFIIPSVWAIDSYGNLSTEFIESRDFVFLDRGADGSKFDTIGYVPNKLLIKAEREIKAAYAAENYAECYRLIHETFEFIPITAKEWCELKAQGLN